MAQLEIQKSNEAPSSEKTGLMNFLEAQVMDLEETKKNDKHQEALNQLKSDEDASKEKDQKKLLELEGVIAKI